jgi:hypothetical protein
MRQTICITIVVASNGSYEQMKAFLEARLGAARAGYQPRCPVVFYGYTPVSQEPGP